MSGNQHIEDPFLDQLSQAFESSGSLHQSLAMMVAAGQRVDSPVSFHPSQFECDVAQCIADDAVVRLAALGVILSAEARFKTFFVALYDADPQPLIDLATLIVAGDREALDRVVKAIFPAGWRDLAIDGVAVEQVGTSTRSHILLQVDAHVGQIDSDLDRWIKYALGEEGTYQEVSVEGLDRAGAEAERHGDGSPIRVEVPAAGVLSMLTPLPDFLSKPSRRIRLVAGTLAQRGVVTLLVGTPGAGKSTFALQLACAVAAGRCLGSFNVPEPGAVVYLNAEDSSDIVKQRFEAIADMADVISLGRIDIVERLTSERLMTKAAVGRATVTDWGIALKAAIVARKPALLVIDPLSMIHELDENWNADMTKLVDFLHEIAREADCAVILVHHSGKDDKKTPSLASSRGASALPAAVRSMWVLSEGSDSEDNTSGQVQLTCVKANYHRRDARCLFQRRSVDLPGGGTVGVLEPVVSDRRANDRSRRS